MNAPAQPGFHERHRLATREAILDGVERRLSGAGLDELTFADVAQASGVSERTVYRHFPTKDALLEAFWGRIQQTLGLETSTRSWADYLSSRREAFAQMDAREPMIRAVMTSKQARETRIRINATREVGIRKVVAEAVGDLPEPRFSELCALAHLLGSAPAWQTFKDYWGVEAERTGEVVAWAMKVLAEAAKAEAPNKNPHASSDPETAR